MTLAERVRPCARCFNLTEEELCAICRDQRRDAALICAVEEASDIGAIERAGEFRGLVSRSRGPTFAVGRHRTRGSDDRSAGGPCVAGRGSRGDHRHKSKSRGGGNGVVRPATACTLPARGHADCAWASRWRRSRVRRRRHDRAGACPRAGRWPERCDTSNRADRASRRLDSSVASPPGSCCGAASSTRESATCSAHVRCAAIAALSYLRGQRTPETASLLKDYIRWEQRADFKRRARRLLDRVERQLA